MLTRVLVLLVTTLLGSLADDDFFNGRRNNFNSNTNFNEILGGLGRGGDSGYGSSKVHGHKPNTFYYMTPYTGKEDNYYPSTYSPSKGTYDSIDYGANEYNTDYTVPDPCEKNSKTRFYRDEDDGEDSRRGRYRPYGYSRDENNINSNANNNIIGSRYRRTSYMGTAEPSDRPVTTEPLSSSYWGQINPDDDRDVIQPFGPLYWAQLNSDNRGEPKYDKSYSSRNANVNTNVNTNTNVLTGRRSNANSNINSNINTNYNKYGGPIKGRLQPTRYKNAPHIIYDEYPGPVVQRSTTASPFSLAYYRRNGEIADDDDYDNPPESDDDVDMKSIINSSSRRSNANSNANSNVVSRIRRSVKNLNESKRDYKISDETSTMADNENSTASDGVAEKWGTTRGALY